MNISKWYGATQTVQDMAQLVKDFNIQELGKVWVATVQILGALPKVSGIASARFLP
eukprot:SAG22_NODE_14686_length_368_cov_0.587361_2_plen_56_part_01